MYSQKYYIRYGRLKRKARLAYTFKAAKIFGNKSLRILDLGCGDGTYSAELEKMGHTVVAMDISIFALRLCRDKGVTHRIRASVTHIPLRSNVFQRALCIDILEHIKDPLQTLNEIHRVLTCSGILALQTPNRKSIISYLLIDPTHCKIYDLKELRRLIRSSHFRNIEINLTSFLSRTYPLNILLKHLFKSMLVATAQK
ncbi:MAG TPA: class I SAM-dependent methyltransferase [Thermoplasmata archaeon]|nr:class I SAM-dependent methyltransferase [Thermoplasmata archaeon]